jgi:hypothetical protein
VGYDFVSSLYALGVTGAYCLPTLLALVRGHPSSVPIMILNLTLGWTGVGWVVALVWSLTKRQREREPE